MSVADRLSSKFHSCHQSFASRLTIHFSDNLSAADIISSDIPAAGGGFKEYMDITMLYIVTFKLKFGTYDIHVHNCWCSSSPGFLIEEIK